MNPMIRKELRQRMRDRRVWVLPTLYLAALGSVVALAYYFVAGNSPLSFEVRQERQGAEVGALVFFAVVYAQMMLLLLMAPVYSAGAFTVEKEQRTFASLITSLLTAAEIWWGKFVAAILFLALLLASALPVLSLSFALGGTGPRAVVTAAGATLLILACFICLGLYCSSYFRRSVHSTAVAYAAVITLTLLTYVVFQILESRWEASGGALRAAEPPGYVGAPLYLNPFYALTLIFEPDRSPYPDWLISLQLFAAIGLLATAFALRNLERGGEQV